MRRINYRSDFRFVLSLKNGNVDLSQSPYWKAVLTTTGTNSYEVSRNGDKFKNCEIDELGKLQVIVENHKLEVGELSIEVTLFIPSTDYSDGIELEPVREKTGIMLVPDGGDAPSELDVQVLMPYVYIDAYEIAKRYGYEGTAEDYIDILKNLGIYATKIEVDSKIEDWHNTHFVMLSEEEYENLQIKDSNTLYFLYEDDFIIEPASEGGAE